MHDLLGHLDGKGLVVGRVGVVLEVRAEEQLHAVGIGHLDEARRALVDARGVCFLVVQLDVVVVVQQRLDELRQPMGIVVNLAPATVP